MRPLVSPENRGVQVLEPAHGRVDREPTFRYLSSSSTQARSLLRSGKQPRDGIGKGTSIVHGNDASAFPVAQDLGDSFRSCRDDRFAERHRFCHRDPECFLARRLNDEVPLSHQVRERVPIDEAEEVHSAVETERTRLYRETLAEVSFSHDLGLQVDAPASQHRASLDQHVHSFFRLEPADSTDPELDTVRAGWTVEVLRRWTVMVLRPLTDTEVRLPMREIHSVWNHVDALGPCDPIAEQIVPHRFGDSDGRGSVSRQPVLEAIEKTVPFLVHTVVSRGHRRDTGAAGRELSDHTRVNEVRVYERDLLSPQPSGEPGKRQGIEPPIAREVEDLEPARACGFTKVPAPMEESGRDPKSTRVETLRDIEHQDLRACRFEGGDDVKDVPHTASMALVGPEIMFRAVFRLSATKYLTTKGSLPSMPLASMFPR